MEGTRKRRLLSVAVGAVKLSLSLCLWGCLVSDSHGDDRCGQVKGLDALPHKLGLIDRSKKVSPEAVHWLGLTRVACDWFG